MTKRPTESSGAIAWDPVSNPPAFGPSLVAEMHELEQRFAQHASHPYGFRNQAFQIVVITVALTVFFLAVLQFAPKFNTVAGVIVAGVVLAASLYFEYVAALQTDLVKFHLARSLGWWYAPEPDTRRWKSLRRAYPQLFNKGTESQWVTDQFWGTIDDRGRQTPFWITEFTYEVRVGKQTRSYHELVVGVQLTEKSPYRVFIQPEMRGFNVNPFTQRDLELEANEFNREFAIIVDKHDTTQHKQVYQALNPALMATLIDFRRECGSFRCLFQGEKFLVSFPGQVLRPKYTTFLRKVEIDLRDVDLFRTKLQTVLSFAHRIREQLD